MNSKNLIVFYFLLCSVFIKSQTNSLVIFSETGKLFNLTINNQIINHKPQSNVKAFHVTSGWNIIEIKFYDGTNDISFKDSLLIKPNPKFADKEFTYVLSEVNSKLHLKFTSVSERSGPEAPLIPEAPKETVPLVDNSIYGHLYQAIKNKPHFFDNFDNETATCLQVLTEKEIKYALTLMTKVNDRETAYRYLNTILENNCYTVLQVKELLEALNNDMDQLNSAKKSYTHITDKENIKILTNLFRYPAMKESFLSFLHDQETIIKQKKLECKEPVSDSKWGEVYSQIKNKLYENEKIILAKKLMADICLSSQQIKKLSELIVHDREKMEFLKSAFYVLTDKENASLLADEFQFTESKTEFLKFINQK